MTNCLLRALFPSLSQFTGIRLSLLCRWDSMARAISNQYSNRRVPYWSLPHKELSLNIPEAQGIPPLLLLPLVTLVSLPCGIRFGKVSVKMHSISQLTESGPDIDRPVFKAHSFPQCCPVSALDSAHAQSITDFPVEIQGMVLKPGFVEFNCYPLWHLQ